MYYSVLRSSKCVLMQIKPLINRIAPPNSTLIYLPSASLVFTSFATFYAYTFCRCACSIFILCSYPTLYSNLPKWPVETLSKSSRKPIPVG